MAIMNYYTKYGLMQTDELEKIQRVINQKITEEENDSLGEGHSDRMFILQLAKEVFATAESRAKYDADLAESMKKRDPDGERKASLNKWYGDAKKYYDNQQYDLAKTAIDRAMQYITPETATSEYYDTSAQICLKLKQHSHALDFANHSIIQSPDETNGYFLKSQILYSYLFEKNLGSDKQQDIFQQLLSNCKLTIDKAAAQGNRNEQAAKCYEYLAETHYVDANGAGFPISKNNNVLAEEYAVKAIDLMGGRRKSCPIADKILKDITSRRELIVSLQRHNAKMEEELKTDTARLHAKLRADEEALRAKLKADNEALQAKLEKDNADLRSKLTNLNAPLKKELREHENSLQHWRNEIGGAEKPSSESTQFYIKYALTLEEQLINAMIWIGCASGVVGSIALFVSPGFGFASLLIGACIIFGRLAYSKSNERMLRNHWALERAQEKVNYVKSSIRDNENNINSSINSNKYKTENAIRENEKRTNNDISYSHSRTNDEIRHKQSKTNQAISGNNETIKRQSMEFVPKQQVKNSLSDSAETQNQQNVENIAIGKDFPPVQ